MINAVGILFKWEQVKADVGEFRQDSDLLTVVKVVDAKSDVFVMVRVPFEPQYFDNYEAVAQGQLAGERVDPILTPAGMAHAKRKLEEPFRQAIVPPIGNVANTEDWVEAEKKLNPGMVASDDSEWETISSSPESTPSEATTEDWGQSPPWEETTAEGVVQPDTENWDEKKEDWDEEKLKEE